MKKYLLFFLFITIGITANSQVSMNMTLLSTWDNDSIPDNGSDQKAFNDVWGYAAPDGREYALIGSAAYVHFFDITDPYHPELINEFAPGDTTTWRDMKTYQDRAYSVSDGTSEGLMIYDLSDLPNDITLVSQTTDFFGSSHDIFIDEDNGRLYAVGTNTMSQGIIVLDIATVPDNPILLSSIPLPGGGYIHDLFVKDNIVYASHGYEGLYIWDMNDPTTPLLMASSLTNGYNHSNWLSEDGSFLIFAEEVPKGLPLGIMDLSNLDNNSIEVDNYFKFPLLQAQDSTQTNNTPHNPYIRGDYAYVSYYEDGLQVWDLSNPSNPVLAGYYDTFPNNTNYNNYWGNWGTYPFLPSRVIIASDRKYGLFLLQFDVLGIQTAADDLTKNKLDASISPNPSNGSFTIQVNEEISSPYSFEIFDVSGKSLNRFELNDAKENINLPNLASGFYFGKIMLEGKEKIQKIIIKN